MYVHTQENHHQDGRGILFFLIRPQRHKHKWKRIVSLVMVLCYTGKCRGSMSKNIEPKEKLSLPFFL